MGKSIYKVGQLVHCSGSFSRGGFGNIVSITDSKSGELYSEKEVITGYGDKNTRVDIEVDIIATTKDLWDITSDVVLLDEKIRTVYDPHNVIPVKLSDFEMFYKIALDRMNNKLDFIRKHSVTRDEKIDIILSCD